MLYSFISSGGASNEAAQPSIFMEWIFAAILSFEIYHRISLLTYI